MGKSLKYGEFEFPGSGVTYVKGYARGGKVSQAKVGKVMHEFGEGKLHSGSKEGPVVKSRTQAIAIGISEGKKAAHGGKKYAAGGTVKRFMSGGEVDNYYKAQDAAKNSAGRDRFAGSISQKAPQGITRFESSQGDRGGASKLAGTTLGAEMDKRRESGGLLTKLGFKKGGHVKKAHHAKKPSKPAQAAIPPGALAALAGAMGGGGTGGAPAGPEAAAPPPPGGPMMKVGGVVRNKSAKLNAKAGAGLPPKSVNVKARLSAGTAGVENLKHGGKVKKYAQGGEVEAAPTWVPDSWTYNGRAKKAMSDSKKAYAKGGTVHSDVKEDKALIKKAFGMHDTQLHESKRTNLSKLKRGGPVCGFK